MDSVPREHPDKLRVRDRQDHRNRVENFVRDLRNRASALPADIRIVHLALRETVPVIRDSVHPATGQATRVSVRAAIGPVVTVPAIKASAHPATDQATRVNVRVAIAPAIKGSVRADRPREVNDLVLPVDHHGRVSSDLPARGPAAHRAAARAVFPER